MDGITFLIIAGFIHCSLFFFNMIFRSCCHYPYLYFLQNTGIEIQTLCVKWSTTVLNRPAVRWGMERSRFWALWFNIGTVLSLMLLPVASYYIVKMTINSWMRGTSGTDGTLDGSPELELMVPGVTIPFSDTGYWLVTIGICSVIHEFGHLLAAAKEDVQIYGVGMLVAYVLPIAYVSMSNEQLTSLPAVNQLRVLCAGIWHNIVLTAFAAFAISIAAWLWSPFYAYGSGVMVKSISPNSPLLGSTGVLVHDAIYSLNDCSIETSESWYHCILEAVRQPTPGYCVDQNLVQEFDESAPARIMPNGVVNCCSTDSETTGGMCFEYIEGPQFAPLQLPPHSCLPARKIIESSHHYCQSSHQCLSQDAHCIRPSLDNTTKVVQLKRRVGKDILFFGHPADIYRTVRVSDWIPKYDFLSPRLPELQVHLCKYVAMISAGFAIINIFPCFFFDGQHIIKVLMQNLLRTVVRHKSLRHAISLTVTCISTLILAMNIPILFVNKYMIAKSTEVPESSAISSDYATFECILLFFDISESPGLKNCSTFLRQPSLKDCQVLWIIYVRVVKSFDNMFSPVQIKQEYPGVDEGNQNVTNGVPAPSEYPIFTNQDVEYMYRQLPQFWGQAQLQTNQMVEDLASKGESHVRQDIAHNQPPVQHLAVANYLQQQSQAPHVMPFQVEQQQQQQPHPHEQENQQGQMSQQQQPQQQQQQSSQQSQQTGISHASQDSHQSQLMMQHPATLNPALLAVQSQVTTIPTTKHNGPGRPPKSSGPANNQSSPPKKIKCQCEICFKEFGHKSNLFIHMRTHNGERPYKCSQCDKCFTHSGNLAIHMRTHSGERPYACQICGKMFSHSGNLSTHLRTHSGVKPYKCTVCGKEFRHSGNLSIHERIHSGIKPFQCKVCGKEFYHSGNLTTHMKKHPIATKGLIDSQQQQQQQQQQSSCNDNMAERSETRIENVDVPSNNPVRLAVNVAPTISRGAITIVRNNDERDPVKSEARDDKRGDESLQFAPPTS